MNEMKVFVKTMFVASIFGMFCALGIVEAQAQEPFADWVDANQLAINQSVPEIAQRALSGGFNVVYDDLRSQAIGLKTLPNANARDMRWIDNFLVAMDGSITTDSLAATDALDAFGPLTQNSRAVTVNGSEVIRSACDKVRGEIKKNPFIPSEDSETGIFIILETRDSPSEDIRVARDEDGEVAQGLWRLAWQWGGAIANANAQCMIVTAQAISDASDRWDNFMSNVAGDQFMWETLINGWLGERVDSLAGTLAYPPEWQLRIIHPEPVMVVSTEGSTDFKARIAIEVLGYRKLRPSDDYKPKNGFSFVVTLPSSSDEKTGYGLLYTRKAATFGLVSQKISGQGNVVSLVFGMTLVDRLENTSKTLKQRRQLIEGQFNAVRNAIENCKGDVVACRASLR